VNTKLSLHTVGILLKLLGFSMLVPVLCSLYYGEGDLWVFVASFALTSGFGYGLEKAFSGAGDLDEIGRKEGFLITSLSWLAGPLFGALPFMLYGVFTNPVDAVFESVSGFTTTGASVIAAVESLPHGILFWRSFIQWLGGMGIVVLAIAVLPRLAVGGMQLMAVEGAGPPTTEKLTPRIAETVKSLWLVYLALSAIMVAGLYMAGMPLFDAVIHMFSALSTGGYSSRNASVGAFDSASIDAALTLFMLLGGTNFSLMVAVSRGRLGRLYRDAEFRYYVLINVLVVAVVTVELWLRTYGDAAHALRMSAFQVVSLGTGTGLTTADYDLWPPLSKWLLFLLLFHGGCAGSTTGALKSVRVLVVLKKVYREVLSVIRPKAVMPIRLGKRVLDPSVESSVVMYAVIYVLVFLVGALVLMALDVPVMTALSASASCLGNVGPGFELVGPTSTYASLPTAGKVDLSLLMLFGRLELFTLMVLFFPAFWKE